MKWLKRLLCRHKQIKFLTNVYGDPINFLNARSIYICKDCGAFVFKKYLARPTNGGKL